MHIYLYTYMYICTYVFTYNNKHVYIYIHIFIYVYTFLLNRSETGQFHDLKLKKKNSMIRKQSSAFKNTGYLDPVSDRPSTGGDYRSSPLGKYLRTYR
jgi:hypothetical protein